MTHRRFIVAILLFALVGWGSFISIITYTAPDESNIVLGLFYLSLSVAIFSALTLLNLYFRKRLLRGYQDGALDISCSLRRGFILTLFFISLLILQSIGALSLFIIMMMLTLAVGLEFYLSRKL